MKESNFKQFDYSLFGKGSFLKGEFKLTGDVYISSNMEGVLSMQDDSKVVFERGSNFEGQVYGSHIEVFGNIVGTVHATETLIIRSSASVSGKIQAGQLIIYPGAILNMEGHTVERVEPAHPSEQTPEA